MCGLKLSNAGDIQLHEVTPCVGVWIETFWCSMNSEKNSSHPAWVCGLKQGTVPFDREVKEVTPCVGVWIETYSLNLLK